MRRDVYTKEGKGWDSRTIGRGDSIEENIVWAVVGVELGTQYGGAEAGKGGEQRGVDMELGYEVRVGVAYGEYFPGQVEAGSDIRSDVDAEAEVGEGREGREELGVRGG